jgi:Flp pilus assembly protein TadD/ketosteroid isomerase-like protein
MRDRPSQTTSNDTGRARPGLATALTLVALATGHVQAQGTKPLRSPAVATAAAPARTAAPVDSAEIDRMISDGRGADALKLIDAALARDSKDPSMRFRRGVALSMLDRKADAIAVFQKLVDEYPGLLAPYNNLAVLYASQGDYDKARVTLEKAIRTNPEYATTYQNLGNVYAQLASQAYSRALQLDKNDATVPPKLALLREMSTTPGGSTTVLTSPAPALAAAPHPTQVAAVTAAPAPRPTAPVTVASAAPALQVTPIAQATTPAPVAKTAAPVAVAAPASVVAPKPPAPAPAPVAASRPAAPAPASAAAPRPAATAATSAPAPAATGNAIHEVEAAVRAWAAAWSRRDVAAYVAAYTPDFTGSAKSHAAWEEDRKARIAPRKRISVELTELRVSVNGDKAEAHFKQVYQSDTLNNTVHKTLALTRTPAGKWLIRQESVGG